MAFRFTSLALPEVLLIEPDIFPDERGYFMETYKRSEFFARGLKDPFVQSNESCSRRGTLRGLHYQKSPKAQGKLIRVLSGEVFDVAVDIRQGSPRFGQWLGVTLSAEKHTMLYVPPGFAHGVCVVSEEAALLYMASAEYAPECEVGIIWNDPALGIPWPTTSPILSPRDRAWPALSRADNNFVYQEPAS